MNANPELHAKAVQRADAAYVKLMKQIDALFQQVSFYLERHPGDGSYSTFYRQRDLFRCVENLTTLPVQLSSVIVRWKEGLPRLMSKEAVEQELLIELWANIQALMYFLRAREIDLAPFEVDAMTSSLFHLIRSNRTLT